MTAPAIAVHDLRKSYGAHEAVKGVSFEVAPGEVYTLLGHNGAGKSTIVEILEGYRTRSSGDVGVLGRDPATGGRLLRDRIGIVLQTSGIETELSVTEAIDLYGGVYASRRPTREVIDLVGLDDKADARVGSLSGGQRRRLDLALGIVGRPDVLFLDEPTTGFDAAARRKSWELIADLCQLGTTVLLTTHYLDEAEHLADRVGVLANGRLVAEGTPAELIGSVAGTVVSFTVDGGHAGSIASVLPPGAVVDGGRVEFTTEQATRDLHAVTAWATERGVELEGLRVLRPTLEDVFLEISSAAAAEDAAGEESP